MNRRIKLGLAAAAAAAVVLGTLAASPAAPAQAQPQTCYFHCKTTTYAGYTRAISNPDPQNNPIGASGLWTVPAVSCEDTQTGATLTAGQVPAWVGLGGVGQTTLEQTGTDSQCNKNGVPVYWPWYEFTGCTSTSQCLAGTPNPVNIAKATNGADKIYPGDNMAADVVEQGPGYFVTQLWDHGSSAHSHSWYYDAIWQITMSSANTPNDADWVIENPGAVVPFPQYSPPILFQNCYFAQDGTQTLLGAGALTKYNLYVLGNEQADTSGLGADSSSFTVTWVGYG